MIIKDDVLQRILPRVERPAQYAGGEYQATACDWQAADVKMCFAFPDTYEIGMSHLGLRLIYEAVNNHSPHLCERCFMPLDDMAAELQRHHLPLFSLESRHALTDFDVVGFTLQYELSYTNVLAMLELADIPLLAAKRGADQPLVIAGGPCAFNPEPIADFLDLVVVGEGEEVTLELLDLIAEAKRGRWDKTELLRRAAGLAGVYAPALYQPLYAADGRFAGLSPHPGVPQRIKKRVLADLDAAPFPERPLLPTIKPVHDRIMLELMRGCTHGCRFCQAGMIYRPLREKSAPTLMRQAASQVAASGYDEIALLSLSSADYSDIMPLMEDLLAAHGGCGVSLSLPSLRVDALSVGMAARTQEVRKSGLTLAPEAGSQRLRDIINKGVREEDIFAAAAAAFSQGYTSIKLYFMIGLPFERDEDILEIAALCRRVLQLAKEHKPAEVKKRVRISLSASSFVPKPHTPFQWLGQNSVAELRRKQQLLREAIKPLRAVSLHYHDAEASMLEAAFARGDRRLAAVLLEARQRGCHLDGWSEHFDLTAWREAFAAAGLSAAEYAERSFAEDEILPWQHLDCGIDATWLRRELHRAQAGELTPDCRGNACSACGVCGGADGWQCSYAKARPLAVPASRQSLPGSGDEPSRWRCRLAVTGTMAWLSHLDLRGSLEKALRRSGLPLAYSQGFNPHLLISWGPAHPVGLSSDSEYVDLTFAADPDHDWPDKLRAALPPGLALLETRPITLQERALMAAINQAQYELDFGQADAEILDQAIAVFLAAKSWPVMRRGSRGPKEVDIRPAVLDMRREQSRVCYEARWEESAAPRPAEMAGILLPGAAYQAWRRGMAIVERGIAREP
ncbi:MAG: TIGR03960 family B12-binding radical SAM protein [Clostridia bacterium]|nr:TIGR03960 family B12-binding radical SAM protein [Clostridia bacterium]